MTQPPGMAATKNKLQLLTFLYYIIVTLNLTQILCICHKSVSLGTFVSKNRWPSTLTNMFKSFSRQIFDTQAQYLVICVILTDLMWTTNFIDTCFKISIYLTLIYCTGKKWRWESKWGPKVCLPLSSLSSPTFYHLRENHWNLTQASLFCQGADLLSMVFSNKTLEDMNTVTANSYGKMVQKYIFPLTKQFKVYKTKNYNFLFIFCGYSQLNKTYFDFHPVRLTQKLNKIEPKLVPGNLIAMQSRKFTIWVEFKQN